MLSLATTSEAINLIYADSAKQDQLYAQQLKSALLATDCNCVIAVGNKGLANALLMQNQLPIFAIRISAASFLEKLTEHPNRAITAIYDEPDPSALIELGKAIFGKYNLALFYSARTAHLKDLSEDVKYIQAHKSSIRHELSRLTDVDAIIVVPDSEIWNTHSFRLAVRSLYRQRKALIGFNKSLVQAGAIAGLFVDDKTYNQQVNNSIISYIKTEKLSLPTYPVKYQIELNTQITRTLNITLPSRDELMEIINNRGRQ